MPEGIGWFMGEFVEGCRSAGTEVIIREGGRRRRRRDVD